MKLTNISLAILVAIGLVACGGSDDKNNQTTDNNNAGNHNTGNNNPPPPPPPKDESGLDPNRVAPDLTVPKDLQTDVNVSKATYLSRGFSDKAMGYDDVNGTIYNADHGTDPANIKYESIYNFLDTGDVIDASSPNYSNDAIGAIYVGQNPDQGRLNNAFVKGKDGKYYRVKTDVVANAYEPDSKFFIVPPLDAAGVIDPAAALEIEKVSGIQVSGSGNTLGLDGVEQNKVVFIANAKPLPGSAEIIANTATPAQANAISFKLGSTAFYDLSLGQVTLGNVSVLNKSYSASSVGQTLDLSELPVKKDEIQFVDVTADYSVRNTKADSIGPNDFSDPRNVEFGKIKAYNLPYSVAYVTVDPSKENIKNIFNLPQAMTGMTVDKGALANQSYQVRGYQTISLPKQGRAHYTGKSFNATVEGDIKLTADFFSDRAGVHGTVTNRKDIVKGKELPNLRLDRLTLTSPISHGTFASTKTQAADKGKVFGDPKVDSWSVQFYGLEAQEAGGKLYNTKTDYEEVYTTQRGKLTNLSNTSDVK